MSTGRDSLVILWELAPLFESGRTPTGEALSGHQDSAWDVAFSPDGNRLVSGGWDEKVILWDVIASHPIARTFTGHKDVVSALAFNPDGSILASSSEDGTFVFWDVLTGDPILPPILGDPFSVYSLTFSPDGRILVTGGLDGMIHFWGAARDANTFGEEIRAPIETHQVNVWDLAFSPDGQLLASGGADDSIMLWDMDESSPTFGQSQYGPLQGHGTVVLSMLFNSSGDKLVTSGSFNVYVWDLSSLPARGERFEPQQEWAQGTVNLLGYSSKDAIMAVAFGANISFWDMSGDSPAQWKLLGNPIPIRNPVYGLAGKKSIEGQTMAVGDDNDLLLLDVATQQSIGPYLSLHSANINSASNNYDESIIATGASDGTVILWDSDLESWQEHACRRANRNLTPEEWRRFFGDEPYRATCPELPTPN